MRGWPIVGLVVMFVSVHGAPFVSGSYDKAAFLIVTKRNRPRMGNRDYFVLGRSASTKQWSFFSAEPKNTHENAGDTAANALNDALDAENTMDLSGEQLKNRLDSCSRKTWFVIDNQRGKRVVTFITFIEKRIIKKLKKSFDRCKSDIDQLAMVRWENIELMVRLNTNETYAHLLFPGCSVEEYRPITLAQEFIDAVSPFFLRQSFERADDERVRMY